MITIPLAAFVGMLLLAAIGGAALAVLAGCLTVPDEPPGGGFCKAFPADEDPHILPTSEVRAPMPKCSPPRASGERPVPPQPQTVSIGAKFFRTPGGK